MSYGDMPVQTLSLVAAADLRTKQFYAIKVDATGKAALAGAAENAIGILQNNPNIGEMATVMTLGVSKVKVGAGGLTAGTNVTPTASGTLEDADGADCCIGVALAAAASGDVAPVVLVTRTASGGAAGNNAIVSLHLKLAKLANGDIVTNFTPGFAGTIKKFSAVVTDPATTGSKAATLNLEIGTTNVTGGVLSLTSANMTPLGATVDATAITAANTFGASDTISVEASSVTPFIEGEISLLIVLG